MLAYTVIVFTAGGAYFGAPIWSVFVGAIGLMMLSAVEHRHVLASLGSPYQRSEVLWALWQSAGHALLASGAAYALGYFTRMSF